MQAGYTRRRMGLRKSRIGGHFAYCTNFLVLSSLPGNNKKEERERRRISFGFILVGCVGRGRKEKRWEGTEEYG